MLSLWFIQEHYLSYRGFHLLLLVAVHLSTVQSFIPIAYCPNNNTMPVNLVDKMGSPWNYEK